MTITAYVMNIDSTEWRLETIEDEIVCGPDYERAQEAAQAQAAQAQAAAAQEAAEDEDGPEDYEEWCNPHA